MKIKQRYELNKAAKVGEYLVCPACGSKFEKTNYQQAFCKTKPKTMCKDKFWNTVTPNKRNNTTRISPASAMYMAKQADRRERYYDDDHPFSSEALGQW